jgi:hypothetical protein
MKFKIYHLILIVVIILPILFSTACEKGTIRYIPKTYTEIIYLNDRSGTKPLYVDPQKSYSIKDGVITIKDYYFTKYSAAPTDDYFYYDNTTITTSQFSIYKVKPNWSGYKEKR